MFTYYKTCDFRKTGLHHTLQHRPCEDHTAMRIGPGGCTAITLAALPQPAIWLSTSTPSGRWLPRMQHSTSFTLSCTSWPQKPQPAASTSKNTPPPFWPQPLCPTMAVTCYSMLVTALLSV